MGKIFAIIVIILIFGCIVGSCDGDTVSYYVDDNGNGKEDFGEGVWYEDKNGVHFYD